jgi:hypothetical protein
MGRLKTELHMTLESLVCSLELKLFNGRRLTRYGVSMFGRTIRVTENTIEIQTPNLNKPGFIKSSLFIGFLRIKLLTFLEPRSSRITTYSIFGKRVLINL